MKRNIISIYCNKCRTLLYLYNKEYGEKLVKCYIHMITKDYTNKDLKCPKCGQQFARHAIIHKKPAHKIIQGKIFVRGKG